MRAAAAHQEQLALSSNLAKAQIDRDQAARDLDVVQKLAAKGAAAPSEVAQAQLRLTLANASLHALQEQKTNPSPRLILPGPSRPWPKRRQRR